ncbi:MAG: hypothetical protein E4H28_01900 [Gemmatimonadales bacterium]|nr:MAG: hypothetical protein E4H28_01900 [Gemmatimonadales bacterium]
MSQMNPTWLALVAALALGCGGGESNADAGGADAGANAGANAGASEAAAPMVDPAVAATVSGTVSFTGAAQTGTPIDMSEEPTCAEKHGTPAMNQLVRVGDGGGLADVFVYVKEGLGDMTFPIPATTAVLDQNGCEYRPHVIGVMAGQDLTIRNSDDVLHNINTQPTTNRGFNVSQPRAGMESNRSFNKAEIMIPVKCDVHGWMNAYIGVTSNPYYATSAADGSFTITGLPPGEYVIEAWHAALGVSTQSITVGDAETGTADFSFSENMAAGPVPMGAPVDLAHPEGHAAG